VTGFLLLGLVASVARAEIVDRVAAVVDEQVVTLSEVYQLGRAFIDERTRAVDAGPTERRAAELEVLDSIIRRRLVSQYLEELQMDVTDDDIERAIDEVSRRHGVERDALRAEVERSGVTWGAYRDEIREALRDQAFGQMIRGRVVENEDQIRDAYRRMQDGAELPMVVDLGAIFLPHAAFESRAASLAQATAIRARFVAGEPFAALSAEFDQGPYGANGGAMGTYRDGELVGELNGPAFSVAVGTVSDPLTTDQGVFLLEIRKRDKEPLRPYEEVRDEIAARIYQGQIDREKDAWYQQQRRKAAVEVRLEEPKAQ
jgi:peptidyl-prolyl cis-trans isomerase SurA